MTAGEPRYTTLADVRLAARIPTGGQAREWRAGAPADVQLKATIVAAERAVDVFCGRRFDPPPPDASPRDFPVRTWVDTSAYADGAPVSVPTDGYVYEPGSTSAAWLPGGSGAELAVAQQDWAPSQLGDDSEPSYGVLSRVFASAGTLRLTARWGWPAVPAQVREASKLLAVRLLHRETSPLGVTVTDAGGVYVARTDHDVRMLLQPWAAARVWDGSY